MFRYLRVTLLVIEGGAPRSIPAPKVTALDTTAAGDVFNGALGLALAEGSTLTQACEFANVAAALSVTRRGTQAAMPTRDEVQRCFD